MAGCWAIRGATTAEANTKESILSSTKELLQTIVKENRIEASQIAAVWFTTTSDLNAVFPALAARQMGWMNVALLCAHEMAVPGSLPQCIRVLILVNTDKNPKELKYVYLKEAVGLRTHGLEPQS
ncbi:MAG: chorismate mutase [SAR202 cluster bacterium]|nr:chorismate mutase [SAR202 cluster bacterium]